MDVFKNIVLSTSVFNAHMPRMPVHPRVSGTSIYFELQKSSHVILVLNKINKMYVTGQDFWLASSPKTPRPTGEQRIVTTRF